MTSKHIIAVTLALLIPTAALAQFYGADGKVTGHATTDHRGSTTFYDVDGRVTRRETTSSDGTTTIYDASGHVVGRIPPPRPSREPVARRPMRF